MTTTFKTIGRASLAVGILAAMIGAAGASGLQSRLGGSEWGYSGEADATARYIQFAGAGRVLGFGGCNRFSGSYQITPEGLTIGPLVATMRACAEDVMKREGEFFRVLESARKADVTKLELVLKAEDGSTLATLARRDFD